MKVHGSIIHSSHSWKHPECPLTDDSMSKMWYVHSMEYYMATEGRKFFFTFF